MKKLLFATLFGTGLLLAGIRVEAQHHYVKAEPSARVAERPAAPDNSHVWVSSEWRWNNGQYVESGGHWAVPPRGHRKWVDGHWSKTSHGSYWVAGYWK